MGWVVVRGRRSGCEIGDVVVVDGAVEVVDVAVGGVVVDGEEVVIVGRSRCGRW